MTVFQLHPIALKTPEMSAEVFADLRDDIKAHGQLVPIVVWSDQVVDGRHRLRACESLGLVPKMKIVACSEEELPMMALSLNGRRNHLTPAQRACYAAELATMAEGRPRNSPISASFSITDAVAAKESGVGVSQVKQVKRIKREGAPEVFEAVRSGRLRPNVAEKIVMTIPRASQATAVEARVAAKKKSKDRKVLPLTGGAYIRPGKRRTPLQILGSIVEGLFVTVPALNKALDAMQDDLSGASQTQRTEWHDLARKGVPALRRVLRATGGMTHVKSSKTA